MDPTNVFGRRIVAYVIDAVLGTVVLGVAYFLLAESIETGFNPCGIEGSPNMCVFINDTTYFAEDGRAAAIVGIAMGFWLFMGWIVQGITGGTPGKLIVGLRVIKQDTGQLAGLSACFLRTILWIVDGQPFGVPLVALITGASSNGRRRVGDMVASTLVVDKSSVGRPPMVPGLTSPAGTATYPQGYAQPNPGQPPAPGYNQPQGVPSPTFQPAAPPDPSVSPYEPAGLSGAAAPAPPQPQWDPARNAWVQWDQVSASWLMWNDQTQQWGPLI